MWKLGQEIYGFKKNCLEKKKEPVTFHFADEELKPNHTK